MLNEYSISEILDSTSDYIPYYIGTFEGTEDPEIDWPHRHSFYSVVWFTEGSGFYVVDFQEYAIEPDRIFLVNPKQIHNWDYSEHSKGYVLMIDTTLALELNLDSTTSYIDIKDENLFFKNIFTNLIEELERNDELSDKNMKSGLSYLYGLIKRCSENQQSKTNLPNPTIERLKRLIFENPHLTTVEQYADILHTTEEYLNSQSKKSTGISAKQYILDSKITETKRQLIYSEDNINEIAFRLGFEDSSYFSRIFKKKTTLSPSDFLKKYRKHK